MTTGISRTAGRRSLAEWPAGRPQSTGNGLAQLSSPADGPAASGAAPEPARSSAPSAHGVSGPSGSHPLRTEADCSGELPPGALINTCHSLFFVAFPRIKMERSMSRHFVLSFRKIRHAQDGPAHIGSYYQTVRKSARNVSAENELYNRMNECEPKTNVSAVQTCA